MIPSRRTYSLSKDQPILRQARQRRPSSAPDRERMEAEFWANFNVEKFARDWRRAVRQREGAAA